MEPAHAKRRDLALQEAGLGKRIVGPELGVPFRSLCFLLLAAPRVVRRRCSLLSRLLIVATPLLYVRQLGSGFVDPLEGACAELQDVGVGDRVLVGVELERETKKRGPDGGLGRVSGQAEGGVVRRSGYDASRLVAQLVAGPRRRLLRRPLLALDANPKGFEVSDDLVVAGTGVRSLDDVQSALNEAQRALEQLDFAKGFRLQVALVNRLVVHCFWSVKGFLVRNECF